MHKENMVVALDDLIVKHNIQKANNEKAAKIGYGIFGGGAVLLGLCVVSLVVFKGCRNDTLQIDRQSPFLMSNGTTRQYGDN